RRLDDAAIVDRAVRVAGRARETVGPQLILGGGTRGRDGRADVDHAVVVRVENAQEVGLVGSRRAVDRGQKAVAIAGVAGVEGEGVEEAGGGHFARSHTARQVQRADRVV